MGKGHDEWLDSRFVQVQAHLKKFEELRSLVEDFECFRGADPVKNVLFHLCLNKSVELAVFETFLREFKSRQWSARRLNDFRGRATNNSWEESESALMEAVVTVYQGAKVDPDQIEPSPEVSGGGRCDIRVTSFGRPVFFELTALGARLFEQKLEAVFLQIADELVHQLGEKRVVKLEVDAARLPLDAEHHLDVDASITMVEGCISRLHLLDLFNSSLSPVTVDIGDIAILPDKEKTVNEINELEMFPGNSRLKVFDPILADLMVSKPFRAWSRTVTPRLALDCPIAYFTTGDARWPLVEVSAQLSFPSASGRYEQVAFLSHLKRSLKQKLGGGQLQPGAPNIVVIKASNWLVQGYETLDDLSIIGFEDIEGAVKQAMDESRNPDLSLVKIYDRDYSRARMVVNPHATLASRLDAKELSKL